MVGWGFVVGCGGVVGCGLVVGCGGVGWCVSHEILVSAQGPLVLGFWVFGFGG